jgi:hypothetical protein
MHVIIDVEGEHLKRMLEWIIGKKSFQDLVFSNKYVGVLIGWSDCSIFGLNGHHKTYEITVQSRFVDTYKKMIGKKEKTQCDSNSFSGISSWRRLSWIFICHITYSEYAFGAKNKHIWSSLCQCCLARTDI